MTIGNLFAMRGTDPKVLTKAVVNWRDPIGEPGGYDRGRIIGVPEQWSGVRNRNDEWLERLAQDSALTIAAWGAIPMPLGHEKRAIRVRELLPNLHALGFTKAGHPRHPLYVRADARPVPLPRHEHEWGDWVMYEGSQERRRCRTCGAEQWD